MADKMQPRDDEDRPEFMDRCEEEMDTAECALIWSETRSKSLMRKARADANSGLEFVLSDESEDRLGDIIMADGWDTRSFKKNPIALFNHNSNFPIGRWENLRAADGALRGHLVLAPEGTSERIDEIRRLVEAGILRAVSVGFRPIESKPRKDGSGEIFMRSELVETSLVSIPANPNALSVAKSLKISAKTLDLVFAEHGTDRTKAGGSTHGKHATSQIPHRRSKNMSIKSLSQRIEDAQNELVAKRDKLTELENEETRDNDAISEVQDSIDLFEKNIASMKRSESKLGVQSDNGSSSAASTSIVRRAGFHRSDVKPLDLLVRAAVVRGVSHFGNKSIDQVLDERYPGHEATAIVTKADQTIGTTTVSGWASELVQTAYADFMQALTGFSVYPALSSRGISLRFDGNGSVTIPSRTAGGAGGGFVAEGAPIRVGRITTASLVITPRKLGVIVPFSRELAKRSTPSIEALVRQAILEDTGVILDTALLDASAVSTARPAGLLNGVAATAAGFPGADYLAVIEDFKALLAPFVAANAADNLTVIMNPAQSLALSMMPGPGPGPGSFGWANALTQRFNIIESTRATAGRLIAIRNSDFATATGDTPEWDVSEHATVHMEDTTPLEIVAATPTTADPVRSFYQTATIGVRMLMDISWTMRRSGMVSWINQTSW